MFGSFSSWKTSKRRQPGSSSARAAPVLECAFQDLVTIFRLHADRYEQSSHGKFSISCGWAIPSWFGAVGKSLQGERASLTPDRWDEPWLYPRWG